jgi:hypothetical protein
MSQVEEAPVVVKKKRPVETQADSTGEITESLKAAVREAIQDEFAITEAWKPRQIVKFIVHCPSGQKALVRHMDTMDLLQYDLIEEMDFFSKRLFANVNESGEEVEDNIWAVLRDPEKRCRFVRLLNRMMTAASVRPKIINDGVTLVDDEDHPGSKKLVFGYQITDIDEQIKLFGKPIPPLKDGECYAGPIDLGDRMAFFSELNKPLGMIEPFREQQNVVLASLESVEGIGGTSE